MLTASRYITASRCFGDSTKSRTLHFNARGGQREEHLSGNLPRYINWPVNHIDLSLLLSLCLAGQRIDDELMMRGIVILCLRLLQLAAATCVRTRRQSANDSNPTLICHRDDSYRERKCADTIGTVLVPWAGHFQC